MIKRDAKGRLIGGSTLNPNGRNGRIGLKALETAIEKFEKANDIDFWSYVLKRADKSDTILVAILKKILPDKIKQDGDLIKNIIVNYHTRRQETGYSH